MKIGVLGGTFDPVHTGHLMIADEAMKTLDLSEVIFVPAGQPLLKPDHPITTAEHRLQMLRLAVDDRPEFRVTDMEIKRPGPSYTVDTIAELRKKYDFKDDMYFILGWDSVAQLPDWREPSRIINMCRLVAIPRPGCSRPDLRILEASIPGISQRIVFLEKPQVDISATVIRERAEQGLSLSSIVPERVEDYIRQNKLYTKH